MSDFFTRFARAVTDWAGTSLAAFLAFFLIAAWTVGGFFFGFSTDYQLVINTGTTIVTFLMVFLIQNTQNRDSLAMHLKLDELIRAVKGARNRLVDLEELSDAELATLRDEFRRLHEMACQHEHRQAADAMHELTQAAERAAADRNRPQAA